MTAPILIADDRGDCYQELAPALEGFDQELVQVKTMEECIEALRSRSASLLLVSAVMRRAFSLLRIVRHSQDLAGIPLVVVAVSGQEELLEKHRQLPSRADRYLLRPVDSELLSSVVEEFLTREKTPPPVPPPRKTEDDDPYQAAPGAVDRLRDELTENRKKVEALEKDLHDALQTARQVSELRDENKNLQDQISSWQKQADSEEMYSSIFQRLEQGYKETIADLERLIHEKDRLINQMRGQMVSGTDEEKAARMLQRLEKQDRHMGDLRSQVSRAISLLDEMGAQADSIQLEAIDLAQVEEVSKDFEFSEDESTQILDIGTIEELKPD